MVSGTCRFGPGTYDTEDDKTVPILLPYLEAAMEQLIEKQPQIFNLTDEKAPGTRAFRVLDRNAYLKGLVTNIQTAGLCAELDPYAPTQDILWVKDSPDFSEEYRVMLSDGFMRRGIKSYFRTYEPSNFPLRWSDYDFPPLGSGCYRPIPPDLYRMNCKFHLKGPGYDILDSTGIVADPVYCAAVGFDDGRIQCAFRAEGWEFGDRVACENWRVGISKNTNKPGPTWTNTEGQLCTGPASGCMVSPEIPYQAWVYKAGVYKVCAQSGKCCEVDTEASR